jgi:sugar lactone lactonase YvrE
VQLFVSKTVRRIFGFALLLFVSVPFGLSISGCKKALAVEYCNSTDSGPQIGQVASITLSQSLATYGESLNYGQIGQSLSASAIDCKGSSVSVNRYVYSSTNGYTSGAAPGAIYADINPATGQICAGTWNRNSGGGVPDYTTCTAPTAAPPNYLAYVTATADGATSNPIPVFVHAVPNSIQIGTPSTNCTTDPTSNCCPLTYTAAQPTNPYTGTSCLSQGASGQIVARVLDVNGNNITCQVGHLSFIPVTNTNIVTIDQNGVATANQPGSATITASVAGNSSTSTAGFFSTCPPVSITLTSNGSLGPIAGTLGTAIPLSATVLDKNGVTITGLALEYESTTPQTIPGGGTSITPIFPGEANITAACVPPTCNSAPFSQIDYLGNGTQLTSNGIVISDTGPSSSVIYVGSTSSQYLYPIDFTNTQPASLIKLPYVPNSMQITQDGSTIYLGSSTALMTVSTANNSVSSANTALPGYVISIAPAGTELVVTDPVRQTVSLVNSSGAIITQIGGVAKAASWSPDNNTVYITTTPSGSYGPQVLVHNVLTAWTSIPVAAPFTDVTVTVPHIGAYFAGADTEGRSVCPTNTVSGVNPVVVANSFYPLADVKAVPDEHITSTDDGNHVLGAALTPAVAINDFVTTNLPYKVACPNAPTNAPNPFPSAVTTHPLTGVTATDITGIEAATNSAAAFVTYTGSSANPLGQLPIYFPASATASAIKLSGAAVSPTAGVFSSDNAFFYVTTSGDNLLHTVALTYPSSGTPTATDTGTLTPNLPGTSGAIVTPNLIVQRPKLPRT